MDLTAATPRPWPLAAPTAPTNHHPPLATVVPLWYSRVGPAPAHTRGAAARQLAPSTRGSTGAAAACGPLCGVTAGAGATCQPDGRGPCGPPLGTPRRRRERRDESRSRHEGRGSRGRGAIGVPGAGDGKGLVPDLGSRELPSTAAVVAARGDSSAAVRAVLTERQPDGSLKRYTLGGELLAEEGSPAGEERAAEGGGSSEYGDRAGVPWASWAPQLGPGLTRSTRNFILPAGFPHSVTPDYLDYMLWQFPVHVTGWTCSTLVTSTLLQAVGVGKGLPAADAAASAVAATAAIKWVSKDGIGAIGKLLVGGRFGAIFDEDPKQWRMYADIVGSSGSIFELATPLAPDYFLLLASLGNLTKAVAKGLKDPSSRVIQNHFAAQKNLGDVAAKNEVWRVGAQMLGLVSGVLLLSSPEIAGSYWTLVSTWCAIRLTHLGLRFKSLSVLTMNTLNFKRAALLAHAHIAGDSMLLGVRETNEREWLLVPKALTRPQMKFGGSIEGLKGHVTGGYAMPQQDAELLLRSVFEAHSQEAYVLVPNRTLTSFVVIFKEGADSLAILRSIWQAEWILQHGSGTPEAASPQSAGHGRTGDRTNGAPLAASQEPLPNGSLHQESPSLGYETSSLSQESGNPGFEAHRGNGQIEHPLSRVQVGEGTKEGSCDDVYALLQAVHSSLHALRDGFPDFLERLDERGWDRESPILKVRPNACILVDG